MKVLFSCLIPVASHVVKKNNRPIWRGRLGKSDVLRSAESYLIQALTREMKLAKIKPITEYVSVKFTFYFPTSKYLTKKGMRNKKVPDMSNLYQLPEDCMQKAGVLFDDNLIENHDGSKRLPHDQGHFLEIQITSLE
jgi:Holliday junction resolvase RusA-like endonuclease